MLKYLFHIMFIFFSSFRLSLYQCLTYELTNTISGSVLRKLTICLVNNAVFGPLFLFASPCVCLLSSDHNVLSFFKSFVSVYVSTCCMAVLILGTRNNRSYTVETSGVVSSKGIRSSIMVGNRGGGTNWSSSSSWGSSIGVSDWSSWLGWSSNILDS